MPGAQIDEVLFQPSPCDGCPNWRICRDLQVACADFLSYVGDLAGRVSRQDRRPRFSLQAFEAECAKHERSRAGRRIKPRRALREVMA